MSDTQIDNTETQPTEKWWQKLIHVNVTWDMLMKNVPFILYIAILAVFYITNNSLAADLVRETEQANKELKELKWQYLDIHSRLIKSTSEEELTKTTSQYGLKPLQKPAFEIKETTEIIK